MIDTVCVCLSVETKTVIEEVLMLDLMFIQIDANVGFLSVLS